MSLLEAVQVNVEEKSRCGLEFGQTLANEHSVGAQVDVALLRENGRGQLADFRVDQWFAAADGNDGRAAIFNCLHALLDSHNFVDRGFVFANAAATRACEVAG